LLAALLFFLGLSLTDFVIGFLGFYAKYPALIFFPFENLFLITALIYLFCVSLLKNGKPYNKIIIRHLFIPSIYFVSHLAICFMPVSIKQTILARFYFPFLVYIENLFYYIISAYYFVDITNLLKKHTSVANQVSPQINTYALNWLRYFVTGFAVYLALDFILSASSAMFHFTFEQQYWKYICKAALTCFLCLAGYNFKENISLSNGYFDNPLPGIEQKIELLTKTELQGIKETIVAVFKTDKPYLDPELDLTQLSKKLGISSNMLSFAINKGFSKNFDDFVNGYRVDEVIEKMKNPANAGFTLLSIAFDCGFNSKTTFNRVFKNATQKSPKEFWDSLQTNA